MDTSRFAQELRLRLWIDGVLRDEVWIDGDTPEERFDSLSASHAEMTRQADSAGLKWMAEAYNPAVPRHLAYDRFGTDVAGIADLYSSPGEGVER